MNASAHRLGKWSIILLQVLLWVVFYLLLLLYTSNKWNHALFGFLNTTIATASYMVATYVHAFWLIPRFLYSNKLTAYLLYSFFFLAILILLRMWAEKIFLLPLHQKFYAFQWAHISFTCITVMVAFLFGALLRVFYNYLKLIQVKNELQSRQAETELNLLKAQVQPHFLFNTLNNIYSLAHSRSEKTPEMIARLSELMRYFIDETPRKTVFIDAELNFIKNYIQLEQIRMLNPVKVSWHINTISKNKHIPPMLLIPFIENVFKHGVDKSKNFNGVAITLNEVDGQVLYKVENTVKDGKETTSGSGLFNLQKRLELLYGDRYLLHTKLENGWYIAELIFPLYAD